MGSEAELASLKSTIEKRNVTSGTLVNYTGPGEMNTDFSMILTEYNQTPDGRFIDQDAGMYLQINPFNLVQIKCLQNPHPILMSENVIACFIGG